jgi:C-terminal processing protease CtpA/Prc
MSYLTPKKIPIGYSLTRAKLQKGFEKESLPRVGKIPATRAQEIVLAIRFGLIQKDRSIAMITEGLKAQPFQGRIAILVNEHSHSAAEMVAAFAVDEGLAQIVGARSAGEVLGGANFRVGNEYRVRIPVAAWYTWSGQTIEGRGVNPDVQVGVELDDLRKGVDSQLGAVTDLLRQM